MLGLLRPQEGLGLRFPQPETFPVAQILIRNRATDLDARMHDGTTPLILAARLAVEGMLEDLINSHADVNAVDDLGKPGAARAVGTGADPARPLLGPSQPSASHTGKSALHWAAAVNNVEAALVLLKNGANKDMQNNKVGGQRGALGMREGGPGLAPGNWHTVDADPIARCSPSFVNLCSPGLPTHRVTAQQGIGPSIGVTWT